MEKDQSPNQTPSTTKPLPLPRHWQDLEELDPKYWEDKEKQKLRGQEFLHRPLDLEKLDEANERLGGLERREFLTIMGASMAMASLASCSRPIQKIVPYVKRPPEVKPGVPTWYASTCTGCSSGCGTLVRTREGRPIKIEGNPDHPVNQGKLCVSGQGSVLGLYDPDRLRGPVAVTRNSPDVRERSYPELDQRVVDALKKAGSRGGVRFLTGRVHGPSTRQAIRDFLGAFENSRHVEYDCLGHDDIALAQQRCYGRAIIPQYRFDKAEVVVSLGADFLGQWVSPVEHSRMWASKRKLKDSGHSSANLSKVYCFESNFTVTGASADERFAVRPGDENRIALAIAHELIVKRGLTAFRGLPVVVSKLKAFTPELVASEAGGSVTATAIKKVADDLWKARGKGLVVAGGLSSSTEHSLELQILANLLNSALGNEGKTVVARGGTNYSSSERGKLFELIKEMKDGKVKVLVIHGTNPVHTLPEDSGFEAALSKVELVVSTADRVDETATNSDMCLPTHHALESWGDFSSRDGLFSLQQPTIAPIFDTRAFEDTLIAWAKLGKFSVSGTLRQIVGSKGDWHKYLKASWSKRLGGGPILSLIGAIILPEG